MARKHKEKGIAGLADGRGKSKLRSKMSEVEKPHVQNKLLQVWIKSKKLEVALLKDERIGRVGCINGIRQRKKYLAVQSVHKEDRCPIERLCGMISLNRFYYYK